MNILFQLWRWRPSLLCQGRYEREMEEEIRVHLAMPIKQNLSSEMAMEEARHGVSPAGLMAIWLGTDES
jgi:hypothetical protein